MQSSRSYIDNWKKIIVEEKTVSVATLKPGNFYKIEVYKYIDGKIRTLSGIKTAYIFLIGKFTNNGKKYFAGLKLKSVNPLYFFNDIKLMLSPNPSTSKDIDEAYDDSNDTTNDEFRNLLRNISTDGRNLFSTIKTKSRIYEGNYREYIVDSVKSVKYISIDPEFLKNVITKDSNKSKNIKEAKDMTNARKPEK